MILGTILIAGLFISERQVNVNFSAKTLAVDIYAEFSELHLVSEDYFFNPSPRALTQWHIRHNNVVEHLVKAENISTLDSEQISRLREYANDINHLMSILVQSNNDTHSDPEMKQRIQETIITRLREEIRLSLGIAINLARTIKDRLEQSFNVSHYLSLIVIVFAMILSLILARWLYRNILWPVDDMQREVRFIRDGQFNRRIDSQAQDEIGSLSRDFDAMAEKLENTMVTRNELEKIVADRTTQLRISKEAAESANEAKSVFLSRMSHELRTPLNAILGFSQLLQLNKSLTSENKKNVDLIYDAGAHLLALINEVLEISRIEQGNMAINFSAVNVNAVLKEVITMTSVQAAARNIKINNIIDSSLNIKADCSRLKQIFINFISNAIKYNSQGGQITIFSSEPSEGKIDICFKDTGIGIEQEKQDRVFVPFERLLNEQDEIEGVGIGLALSARLAELMDAELGFVSEPGQGSTFWIRIERMN